MTISRAFPAVALAASLLLAPAAARAGHRGMNVSTHHDADVQRCSDLAIEFDDREAVRSEETRTVAVEAGRALAIRAPENSGVYVRGADRPDFSITLCKAAASKSGLDAIALSREAGAVSVRGPSGDGWAGYLIVVAPRQAAMDLTAENGPLSLSGLSGRVAARSENGPISIRDSAGDIDAHAENGPISARGDGGRLRLSTENGPIAVGLSGAAWQGEGLDARAVNGPVALAVPAGYRSGTRVESLGNSPFRCRGSACDGLRRTWDDDHKRLELGEGPVLVRLSTENGPVSVRTGDGGAEADDD